MGTASIKEEIVMKRDLHDKKVSVIIPTYNRATFIPNAVKSIVDQNYDNLEIIIVDDGSTDDTQAVVNALRYKNTNINYYQNTRSKGPSGARNTGILMSSGDYLAFLDSDDVWLSDHLSNGLRILNEHPDIDAVFGNYSIVDFKSGKHLYDFFDKKEILHNLKSEQFESGVKILQDNVFTALLRDNFFSLCSLIVKKSSCANILLDESIGFSEDRDFAIRLFSKSNIIVACRLNPVFIAYTHDLNTYNTVNSERKKIISRNTAETEIYLYIKYLNEFKLSDVETRFLKKIIANKLSDISYDFWVNKEYKAFFLYMSRSFKYHLTFIQFKNLLKVLSFPLIRHRYK